MTLDVLVIAIYVAGMLALGWFSMRRSNNQAEFLVAGRRLGPTMYISTMAATVLGGASTIGSVRLGYVYGISGVWLCAAIGAGIIVLNLFLAKPMIKLRIYTVTQVLERRYSSLTRQMAGVIMFAYALMIGVVSTLGISTVLQVFLGVPLPVAVLLSGGLVVFYSTVGGMWALTLTDVAQFVITTIGLLIFLLPISMLRVGGWDGLTTQLPADAFSFGTIGIDTIITYILIYTFGVLIGQDIWQRVFTARDSKVARYAGTGAGIYCILYGLATAIIGMCAAILLPDLADPNNAFAAIIQTALPAGIRGLAMAAAMAAMMSTASAGMLAASSTFAEDLLPKLRGGKETSLGVLRLCTFVVGVLVLAIGLMVTDVLNALTVAYNLLVGGMLIPLIGAIFWKRASPSGALTAMILGAGTALLFMALDGIEANTPIYYSLSIGLVSFVLVSMFTQSSAASDDEAAEVSLQGVE